MEEEEDENKWKILEIGEEKTRKRCCGSNRKTMRINGGIINGN